MTASSKEPTWRRQLLILGVFVVLALLGVWGWWVVTGLVLHDKVIADAKAAGISFDVQEALPPTDIPPEEDAGVDVAELARLMAYGGALRTAVENHDILDLSMYFSRLATDHLQTLTDDKRKALVAELAAPPFGEVLALLEPIAHKPRYAYTWNITDGLVSSPHVWAFRDAINLLLVRAFLQEDAEAVTRDLVLAMKVAARLHQEPRLWTTAIAYQTDREIAAALAVILNDEPATRFNSDQLQRLLAAYAERRHPHGDAALAEAYRMMYATTFQVFFQKLRVDPAAAFDTMLAGEPLPTFAIAYKVPLSTLSEREEACYLRHMITLKQAAARPVHHLKDEAPWEFSTPRYCMVLNLLGIHYLGRTLLASADHEASLAMAETALTVLLYQDTHDALPTADQIAIPDDPYTGRPLVFRQDAPGDFLLYSIGRNWLDDHGDPGQDLVFRFKVPAQDDADDREAR